MEFLNLKECIIENHGTVHRKLINEFLMKQGLRAEESIEYTFALLNEDKVVATGSLDGKVIKCVAVDENYQGMGITNKVISNLLNEAHRRGRQHLFVYTKPKNLSIFSDLGFYKIAEVSQEVVLLENQPRGIDGFIEEISSARRDGSIISAIVVNCNPFTLGHQYLIEKAAKESDFLHIFVVSEDKSDFPTEVRLKLVKEGTKHLENVIVHQTKNYLISSATFPSYFMKKYDDTVKTHALLDIQIFAKYFVPALGINRRYVGEEPFCQLTSKYNSTMKTLLPNHGVEVIEVPRRKGDREVISASRVRKLLREGKLINVKQLVPINTYQFLISEEGQRIIEKMEKALALIS
ncbi:[citrate (pro-3S)-lyase] ligase [Anaerovirgula multivorans]|uniref:[Citrate [pro-3S]-lyase] ligase n=1 Tax=Anaerovirgula multivorans TaxID=312168 RepID=A0A239FTH1_9FIRM|nr:[citrate (pro-3S)-lyase] ligase [Anaerovirgula multivorans]SNS59503.1 [citrate (pro-3S)-lyase] ligase [Anaerovirgula multivorans]